MEEIQTLKELDKIEIATSIECDYSDLSTHLTINKKDLTIISQNICSIYCNFDDFIVTLSSFDFEIDIIILTECRLDINKPIPQISGYHSFCTTYHMNQNDGVVVFIKNTLNPKIKEIKLTHASCIQVDVLNNSILCIYRSPSIPNAESFINSLTTCINNLSTEKNIIIAGDININIRPKETETSYEYKNRISYLNILIINHPKSTIMEKY